MSLILAVDWLADKPTLYQFDRSENPYPNPENYKADTKTFESAFELKKHIEELSRTAFLVVGHRLPCAMYSPMTPEFINTPLERETLIARFAHGQIPEGEKHMGHITDISDISKNIEQIAIYDPVQKDWDHQLKEIAFDCFYGLRIRGATYSAISIQKQRQLDSLDNVTLTVNFSEGITVSASRGIKIIDEYFDCITGYNLERYPQDIAYHMMGLTTQFGQPNHIVFTGKNNLNKPHIRAEVLEHLPLLDFTIDEQLLQKRTNGVISQIGSRVRVFTLEDQSAIDMFRRIKHALEYREYVQG